MILCSTVVYSNSRWHTTVFEGRKRKSFKTVISWPRAKPGKIQFVPDHQINAMPARDASRGFSCSKAHFRLRLLWFVTMGYIQNFSPRNFKKSTLFMCNLHKINISDVLHSWRFKFPSSTSFYPRELSFSYTYLVPTDFLSFFHLKCLYFTFSLEGYFCWIENFVCKCFQHCKDVSLLVSVFSDEYSVLTQTSTLYVWLVIFLQLLSRYSL